MIKFFKKLKEKIDFLKWAYKFEHRDIGSPHMTNGYIKVNNIEPTLIQCVNTVGNGELAQYEWDVRRDLLEHVMNELDKILVMEKEDLFNGTSRVEIKFYVSPFVKE